MSITTSNMPEDQSADKEAHRLMAEALAEAKRSVGVAHSEGVAGAICDMFSRQVLSLAMKTVSVSQERAVYEEAAKRLAAKLADASQKENT